jgi:hypothetical protein
MSVSSKGIAMKRKATLGAFTLSVLCALLILPLENSDCCSEQCTPYGTTGVK